MNTGRKMRVVNTTWQTIPWNRNCKECVHFVAAPPEQQGQQALLLAVWTHFNEDHGIMLFAR